MHSVNERPAPRGRPALAGLLALQVVVLQLLACGNYSNDDLVFLSAIPHKEQLQITVPKSQVQALCALGSADAAVNARATGDSFNASILSILTLVDLIRAVPPTSRDADSRSWGPWNDDQHAGVRYLVRMVRTLGATPVQDSYAYAFNGSLNGAPFVTVISGQFFGSEAEKGSGLLRLDFDASRSLGTNKPGDPSGAISVAYDLSGDPRSLELQLDAPLGPLQSAYRYHWLGYADGRALFDFAVFDATRGIHYDIDARFTAAGDGRAGLSVTLPGGLVVSEQQCFDGQACLSWLSDPYAVNAACLGVRPCTLGQPGACASGVP